MLLSQKCGILLIHVITDEKSVKELINLHLILIYNFGDICSNLQEMNSPLFCSTVRFRTLNNNHLEIRGIRKTDEGVYTCEGRIKARGEVDFRSIKVVVNGELLFALLYL